MLDIQYVLECSLSPVRMFALCFDAGGEIIGRVQIVEFFAARTECAGSVFLPVRTCQVGLAVHIGSQESGFRLNLVHVNCRIVWNPEGYDDGCNSLMLS